MKRIVVIDDEYGQEVLSFSCPEEAYENIRSNGEDIPLIVLDIMIDADGKNSGGINRGLFFYLSLRGENVRAFIAKHNIKLNELDEHAVALDEINVLPIKGNTKVAILTNRRIKEDHINALVKITVTHKDHFFEKVGNFSILELVTLIDTEE
ncbi:MAG: hypothetical protein HYV28_15150 [Ignavibacteriales bacterium]|nr:hypothetical protein [Ignavibacteriales bacterium]